MIASVLRVDAELLVGAQADPGAAPEAPIVYAEEISSAEDPCTKGKEKKKGSRWNAVRHGCMAKLLLPADLEIEAEKCTAMLTECHCPTSDHEAGIIARMGRLAAQIERNQKLKVVDLQRTMDRAVLCWDEDRAEYIFKLVKELGKVPGVAAALGQSKQGAEWLLRTWNGLAYVLEKRGKWSEEESRLVMDLLEIRAELRSGMIAILSEDDPDELALIVEEEVGRIENRLNACVLACDHADRWMAAAGMPQEESAETKRLRKQESKLKLEYRRAKAELLDGRDQAAAAAAGPAPAAQESPAPVVSATRPEPAQKPAPEPRPTMSNAAWKYHLKRQDIDALELPETASAPAQRVAVRFPFPGGDPEPEAVTKDESEFAPEAEPVVLAEPAPVRPPTACVPSHVSRTEAVTKDESEFAPEAEPVVLAEPAPVRPPTACVPSHASRTAVADQRRDRDRKARRNQEKKARKAARRNGR